MMKLPILVAVLAVVSLVGAMPPSEVEEPVYMEELDNGVVESERNNVLLHSEWISMFGVPNTVLTRNWSWRGAFSNRISSWHATGSGGTVTLTGGGFGNNNLSLRIVSWEGWGLSYRIEIYGTR